MCLTCKIQWIDENGKRTPDSNVAVAIAYAHEAKSRDQRTGRAIEFWPDKFVDHYPICQDHLARVESEMLFENGGSWSFEKLGTDNA